MSWRTVVISKNAKLDYQLGYLVVRNQDVVKIHINEIAVLIIETTSVSLTAALLCELTKKKVKIIFCDENAAFFDPSGWRKEDGLSWFSNSSLQLLRYNKIT